MCLLTLLKWIDFFNYEFCQWCDHVVISIDLNTLYLILWFFSRYSDKRKWQYCPISALLISTASFSHRCWHTFFRYAVNSCIPKCLLHKIYSINSSFAFVKNLNHKSWAEQINTERFPVLNSIFCLCFCSLP